MMVMVMKAMMKLMKTMTTTTMVMADMMGLQYQYSSIHCASLGWSNPIVNGIVA